jgi:hypothetical protein
MPRDIELKEFDAPLNKNKHDIHKVQNLIESTAPQGSRVTWTYPGYTSIVLSNGIEIAFGDSLDDESGYTWNSYDVDGTCNHCGYFEEPATIEEIPNKLWQQAAALLPGKEDK